MLATACDGDDNPSADRATAGETPATTATTAAPAPDCGNPVASFAPLNPMPPPGDMPSGTYMDEIQQRGRLIAGVSADTLLFGYCNPLTGQLEGFDIDLVRQVVAGDLRRPRTGSSTRSLTYAQRIPALQDGSVDIVADVMTVNCERWAQISFSSQYFDAGQKILVRSDSPVTDISQLDGKRMCAARGSTNIDNLKNYPEVDRRAGRRHLRLHGAVPAGRASTRSPVTTPCSPASWRRTRTPRSSAARSPASPTASASRRPIRSSSASSTACSSDVRDNGTWAQMYRTWLQPTGAGARPAGRGLRADAVTSTMTADPQPAATPTPPVPPGSLTAPATGPEVLSFLEVLGRWVDDARGLARRARRRRPAGDESRRVHPRDHAGHVDAPVDRRPVPRAGRRLRQRAGRRRRARDAGAAHVGTAPRSRSARRPRSRSPRRARS